MTIIKKLSNKKKYINKKKMLNKEHIETSNNKNTDQIINENNTQNTDQIISENNTQNTDQIINENNTQNTDQIINEKTDQKTDQNTDQIINENTDKKINKTDQIINENIDQIINENTEQKTDQKINEKHNDKLSKEEYDEIINKNSKISKYKSKNKKNLVLCGGGIKGICHIGGLLALEELGVLKNIETIAGTSIGAFIGSLIILGWKSNEIYNFLLKFKFDKMIKINLFNLTSKLGLDDGANIEYVIKRMIKFKKYNENITLEELYKLTKIKLIITGSNLNKCEAEYFSYENNPKMPLYLAIRISMSVPYYLQPIKYNNITYVDGGCLDNYPIDLFENNLEETIGILFLDNIDYHDNIDNLEILSKRLWQTYMVYSVNNQLNNYNKHSTVVITPKITTLKFSLDAKSKKELFLDGYQKTLDFFKNV